MTKLLEEILAQVAKLPPERQDELAAILAKEIEAEARWEQSFAASQDALAKMADEALADNVRGTTRRVDPQ